MHEDELTRRLTDDEVHQQRRAGLVEICEALPLRERQIMRRFWGLDGSRDFFGLPRELHLEPSKCDSAFALARERIDALQILATADREHAADALEESGQFRIVNLNEALEEMYVDQRNKLVDAHWGNWYFNRENHTLVHNDATYYEIDLDKFSTSAQLLDTIFQLAGKNWCTWTDIGALIDAVKFILDPQANLCSWGYDHPIADVAELIERELEDIDTAGL